MQAIARSVTQRVVDAAGSSPHRARGWLSDRGATRMLGQWPSPARRRTVPIRARRSAACGRALQHGRRPRPMLGRPATKSIPSSTRRGATRTGLDEGRRSLRGPPCRVRIAVTRSRPRRRPPARNAEGRHRRRGIRRRSRRRCRLSPCPSSLRPETLRGGWGVACCSQSLPPSCSSSSPRPGGGPIEAGGSDPQRRGQ